MGLAFPFGSYGGCRKYKGSPLIKNYLREVGWGGEWGYKSHQGEQNPISRNHIPGPGPLGKSLICLPGL